MARNVITWKNIGNRDVQSAADTLINSRRAFAKDIQTGLNFGAGILNQADKNERAARQETIDLNTQDVIADYNRINSPEQLEAFKNSPTGSVEQVRDLYDDQVNAQQLNKAFNNLPSSVANRASAIDNLKNFSESSKATQQEINNAIAEGDATKAFRTYSSNQDNLSIGADKVNASNINKAFKESRNRTLQNIDINSKLVTQINAAQLQIDNANREFEEGKNSILANVPSEQQAEAFELLKQTHAQKIAPLQNNIKLLRTQGEAINSNTHTNYNNDALLSNVRGKSQNFNSNNAYNLSDSNKKVHAAFDTYSRTPLKLGTVNQTHLDAAKLIQLVETGGEAKPFSAKNPKSTASGATQTIDATKKGLFNNYSELAASMNVTDPFNEDENTQTFLALASAKESEKILNKAGVPYTKEQAYFAHLLGQNDYLKYSKLNQLSPNSPISDSGINIQTLKNQGINPNTPVSQLENSWLGNRLKGFQKKSNSPNFNKALGQSSSANITLDDGKLNSPQRLFEKSNTEITDSLIKTGNIEEAVDKASKVVGDYNAAQRVSEDIKRQQNKDKTPLNAQTKRDAILNLKTIQGLVKDPQKHIASLTNPKDSIGAANLNNAKKWSSALSSNLVTSKVDSVVNNPNLLKDVNNEYKKLLARNLQKTVNIGNTGEVGISNVNLDLLTQDAKNDKTYTLGTQKRSVEELKNIIGYGSSYDKEAAHRVFNSIIDGNVGGNDSFDRISVFGQGLVSQMEDLYKASGGDLDLVSSIVENAYANSKNGAEERDLSETFNNESSNLKQQLQLFTSIGKDGLEKNKQEYQKFKEATDALSNSPEFKFGLAEKIINGNEKNTEDLISEFILDPRNANLVPDNVYSIYNDNNANSIKLNATKKKNIDSAINRLNSALNKANNSGNFDKDAIKVNKSDLKTLVTAAGMYKAGVRGEVYKKAFDTIKAFKNNETSNELRKSSYLGFSGAENYKKLANKGNLSPMERFKFI